MPPLSIRLFLILVATLVLSAPAAAADWGPWSVSATAPTIAPHRATVAPLRAREGDGELVRIPFSLLLGLYKNYISPLDGDRCPMQPNCSHYASQAIRKHGLLIGIVMTADRLMHEADERNYRPAVRAGNRYLVPDPLHNNDFWWYQP